MDEFLAGLFVFVMISVLFGLVDAVFPILPDDAILSIAAVLGVGVALYSAYKKAMA